MSRIKDLKYMFFSRPYRLERPLVIQFPVIDVCNSKCQMCYIWKNKEKNPITPEEICRGLRQPIFRKVKSVGINGGEPTLRRDLADLTQALFASLPKMKSVSLITNAYNVDQVTQRIDETGIVVKKYGGYLDVMVSLDGYGSLHDLIRGRDGSFDNAYRVIQNLRSNSNIDSIRIGYTIVKDNVYGLHDLLEFCQKENLYVKFRLGIPHKRLYTNTISHPFMLDDGDILHITTFLEGIIRRYERRSDAKAFLSFINRSVDIWGATQSWMRLAA